MWKRLWSEDGLSLFFLACLSLSAMWAVERGGWLSARPPLALVALGAIALGFWFARFRLPGALLHGIAVVLGAGVILALTAGVLEGPWRARVAALAGEVSTWAGAVRGEDSRTGVVVFVGALLAIVWLSGYFSSWLLFRGWGPWMALATSGPVLLVTLASLPPRFLWHVIPYVVAALLLVSQVRWTGQRHRHGPGGLLLAGWVLVLGAVVVGLAWPMPLASKAPLRGTFDRFQDLAAEVELEMERLFSAVPNRRAEAAENFPLLGLDGDLTLKEGQPLGTRVLFRVSSPRGTYWRLRTFDTYTSWGWSGSATRLEPFPEAVRDPWQGREEVSYEVRLATPADVFAVGGEALALSLPADVQVLPPGSFSSPGGGLPDVVAIQSRNMLASTQRYTVVSSLSRTAPAELREAGESYPAWVADRYLQLSRLTPERVRQVAEDLTAGLTNPYDKAMAIQTWLNNSFRYSLNVPAPPFGADAVDYFLFESQTGFCDYYGSAMAVMLRSVGVPARVATGFAKGDWDAERREWVVREWHAHTWTEAFFPRYGWVAFEPTPPGAADQPRRDIVLGPAVGPVEGAGGGEDYGGGPLPELLVRQSTDLSGLSYLALAAVGALLFVGVRRIWRWWNVGEVTPALRAYSQVCRLAVLAGLGPRSQETPQEYAGRLAEAVPSQREHVVRLSQLYIQVRYAQDKGIGAGQYLELEEIARRLRWPLLRRALRLSA